MSELGELAGCPSTSCGSGFWYPRRGEGDQLVHGTGGATGDARGSDATARFSVDGVAKFVDWLGVARGKFFDWRTRYGKADEHNALVLRDHGLEYWEKKAIIDFTARIRSKGIGGGLS